MKCNQCGTDNELGARFCKTCGSPMEEAEQGNGIACMVLGIVAIVFGCTPLIGLVCGIIAIIMNRKDMQIGIQTIYHEAGNICGIIGVCLGGSAVIDWSIWVCALA